MTVHLSYKPPSSWRVLFLSGGYPRNFSRLKKFRALVVPGKGLRKGVIIQGIMTSTGVLTNIQSSLRRKGGVTGAYVHAPIQRNSTCIHMVSRSIYDTIRHKNPHLPICRYKRCPQGPPSYPRYR